MSKKIICALICATLAFVLVFAACNKAVYKDKSGKEYLLVTDENGEKILNENGELLVYVTDEKGRIQEDESGNPVTEMQGFVGQIEENGTVEDYAYKVALPSGWKISSDNGKYENKSKNEKIQIAIEEYFYDDYIAKSKLNYEALKEAAGSNYTVEWKDDVKCEAAGAVGSTLTVKNNEGISITYIFENNGNVYHIIFTADNTDEAQADFDAFLNSISFKDYKYWDDVTSVPTTADESAKATDSAATTTTTTTAAN